MASGEVKKLIPGRKKGVDIISNSGCLNLCQFLGKKRTAAGIFPQGFRAVPFPQFGNLVTLHRSQKCKKWRVATSTANVP